MANAYDVTDLKLALEKTEREFIAYGDSPCDKQNLIGLQRMGIAILQLEQAIRDSNDSNLKKYAIRQLKEYREWYDTLRRPV